MKCKHNFQQLLNHKGKPLRLRWENRSDDYILFCTKCGEVKEVTSK